MVINTNVEAQRTANNLMASQKSLAQSLARLSSGSKVVNPADDAAGLAVSSRLESQMRRIDGVLNNLAGSTSYVNTQDSYLKNIGDAISRMNELAVLAQDPTKNSGDLKLYEKEMDQLQEFLVNTSTKKFNGIDLFGENSELKILIDEDGSTLTIPKIDLADATSKLNTVISTTTIDLEAENAAKTAAEDLQKAFDKIQEYRAGIGAVQTRLNYINTQIGEIKQNLSAAKSRITDVDMAAETTEYAKKQILVQSGTQMLREANNLPQTALELLR